MLYSTFEASHPCCCVKRNTSSAHRQGNAAVLHHRQSGNQAGYLSCSCCYWQEFSSRENKYTELVVVMRVT